VPHCTNTNTGQTTLHREQPEVRRLTKANEGAAAEESEAIFYLGQVCCKVRLWALLGVLHPKCSFLFPQTNIFWGIYARNGRLFYIRCRL